MKKLLTYLFGWMLTNDEKKDHVNGCLQLICKDHDYQTQILIFERLEAEFVVKMMQSKENELKLISDAKKNVSVIDKFLKPTDIENITVKDATFLEPIKTN